LPYRERLWGLLATALSTAGRQADALAAIREVRDLLDDELGLAPGLGLRALEQAILSRTWPFPAPGAATGRRPDRAAYRVAGPGLGRRGGRRVGGPGRGPAFAPLRPLAVLATPAGSQGSRSTPTA
jgi:hypothetical protein